MITPNLDEVLREYSDDGGNLEVERVARMELSILQSGYDGWTIQKNMLEDCREQLAARDERIAELNQLVEHHKEHHAEETAVRDVLKATRELVNDFMQDAGNLDNPQYRDMAWKWFKAYELHFKKILEKLDSVK